MQSEELLDLAQTSLEDLKAQDVTTLDVRKLTSMTDYLLIASGTSDRHVRSLADKLIETVRATGVRPLGIEGQESAEWVLIDLNDVIVHVMQGRTREFYKLEDLWTLGASPDQESAGH